MKGQQIYKQAIKKIPGGTQLLSKRPEMYLPEQWPSYYSKAKGVEVWDLDNKRYIDMSNCSVGACVLGYADPDVDSAVRAAIEQGSISTLNCLEEVELADLLCELHPWADMVRYARSGGEAMAAAVRIARANSGKDKIAFCGYHGWHDWYLAANIGEHDALDGHLLPGLSPAGVPRALANTALPFHYNKIEELEEIVSIHSKDLGTIVMEPIRSYNPESNFLAHVREIASDIGAVLVFDEITSGWRLNNGGAHLKIGVNPDIAVFSKAMSNGYPMASIIGTKSVMQAAENTFISSTYWTERIGPTAALATIQKYGNCNVSKHLRYIGECIQDIWLSSASTIGLPIEVGGISALPHFSIVCDESQVASTLFTQLMLEKGFLATNAFKATYAHRDEHMLAYSKSINEVFSIITKSIGDGDLHSKLQGPVAHSTFRRLT